MVSFRLISTDLDPFVLMMHGHLFYESGHPEDLVVLDSVFWTVEPPEEVVEDASCNESEK